MRDLKETDGAASFLYGGDMNALTRRLAAGEIADLSITDPDLEEIFMHYYDKEGEAK